MLIGSRYCIEYKSQIKPEALKKRSSAHERKAWLPYESYCHLAKKSLEDCSKRTPSFAHLFVVMCWNLVARSFTIANLRYDHITWEGDAMVIALPLEAPGEPGEIDKGSRHLYANPDDPDICPILALALHKFTGKARVGLQQRLFAQEAKSCESRFGKWFIAACRQNERIIELQKSIKGDLGTRSLSLGASKYLLGTSDFGHRAAAHARSGMTYKPVRKNR